MPNITCARCGSAVHCLNSCTSTPPWCPVCGADFQATREVTASQPIPVAETPPSVDIVPLTVAAPTRAPAARAGAARRAPAARTTVPLPARVPAEVAGLGNPDRVYATDPDLHRGMRRLTQGLLALLVLTLLAVAGFHFYIAEDPRYGYNLTAETARGVGIGFAVVSLVLTIAGVACSGTSWGKSLWGPRSYLVYPDVLVELRTGRHRVIPLEQVGEGQYNAFARAYCFAVKGSWALTFDDSVHDAAGLAQTIRQHAAQRQHRLDFGDDATLAELRSAPLGPSVLTHAVAGRPGLVYRITLLGDRLLFVCLGPAVLSDTPETSVPVNMGLIGGLIGGFNAWAHMRAREKTLAMLRELEAADAPTLVQMALEKEGSFVAELPDLRELRLEPLSTMRNFLTSPRGVEQVCALRIAHTRQGGLTLALLSRDDVMTVVGPWAEVFGEVLTVAMAWSHSRCGFV